LAIIFNNANWSLAAAILGAVSLFTQAPAGHFYLELPRRPTGAGVEITALDLGAGGAIHVRTRKSDWLIDSGSDRDFKRTVRGYLRSRGINQLDGLLLTHGDSQHLGGAAAMLRVFRPPVLVDSVAPDRSGAHRTLIELLRERQFPRRLCAAPDEFAIASAVWARILFPPPGYKGATADDQTLVVELTIEDRWRVLCMSDSGEATERWLLKNGADLRSDILIKGQHHSGISGTPEFLNRVAPRAIVASAVDFPENERMKDDWAADVSARGIKLFRQDETGAMTLRFMRDRWEAISYLTPDVFRSDSR
jgi:competence protein ComEC